MIQYILTYIFFAQSDRHTVGWNLQKQWLRWVPLNHIARSIHIHDHPYIYYILHVFWCHSTRGQHTVMNRKYLPLLDTHIAVILRSQVGRQISESPPGPSLINGYFQPNLNNQKLAAMKLAVITTTKTQRKNNSTNQTSLKINTVHSGGYWEKIN